MDKAKGGGFEGGRWIGGVRGCGGVKMEITVLEQQYKKILIPKGAVGKLMHFHEVQGSFGGKKNTK